MDEIAKVNRAYFRGNDSVQISSKGMKSAK